MKKKTTSGNGLKKVAVIGAVAGAAYMLIGPDGKKNQAKLKNFANKVKKEVMEEVKGVKSKVKKGVKVAERVITKEAKEAKKEIKKVVKKGASKMNKW